MYSWAWTIQGLGAPTFHALDNLSTNYCCPALYSVPPYLGMQLSSYEDKSPNPYFFIEFIWHWLIEMQLSCYYWCLVAKSCPALFAAPWTVARQAPLSMAFYSPELEWVAFPFSRGSSQGSNLCLLHWQADSLPLSHQGSLQLSYRTAITRTLAQKSLGKKTADSGKDMIHPREQKDGVEVEHGWQTIPWRAT